MNQRSLPLLLLFLASLLAPRLDAQQTLGSINGTVTDASDAAIPGATVIVTDAAINVTRTTRSTGNGTFEIYNLPPGIYQVQISHAGFDSLQVGGLQVLEAQAKTIPAHLKVGEASTSVEVTADSLLNATDSTNGYTLDSAQIAETPLATGSFTQLAVLSPGVNAELLSSLDSNAGLGNQNIWANGQRASSNDFQFNGVDTSNIFNAMSASNLASQRWNFNIGEGHSIAGASQTSTSSFGSIGNSMPSAPPEFLQEIRVNTSNYDVQQGATAGAQIDVNTKSGTNELHGQVYGTFANNSMNAAPFFYKQDALLAQEGVGAFPMSLANPALHRWTTGAELGGPLLKNKLYFWVGYQHLYVSDDSTGISQLNVPSGLTDDRSATGINNALTSWNNGTPMNVTMNPIAMNLLQTQLPNGQYLIPSAQSSAPYAYGVPNVTLVGTSLMTGNQAGGSVDYDMTSKDRISFKYYYQNDPVTKPFGVSQTGGFPSSQYNGSQVAALDNTILIGSRINWEQRIGFSRMGNYSYFSQAVTSANPAYGANFGIGGGSAPGYLNTNTMPGLDLKEFAANSSVAPGLTVGPNSAFDNTGFFQNRLNPSTNLIYTVGQHTFYFGGGYSYTQLNLENDRTGIASVASNSFETFLEGTTKGSTLLDTIDPATGQNDADRYYRSNEFDGYAQDQWKARNDLTLTFGVRYDYHGGLTEKYGNMFNFDPNAYDVTGTDTTGFNVVNSGFVVAGNNKTNPSAGVSNSTLNGRQWGFSPRVGFAWQPKRDDGKFVVRGGVGIYYDRGELFSYLSQPAGSGIGGPFGVTESAPLGSYVTGSTGTLSSPFGSSLPLTGTSSPPLPNSNPATMVAALQAQLNGMIAPVKSFGPVCGGVEQQEYIVACNAPLSFAAYDKNNVLPYTIDYNFNIQWQPANDLAVTIGYVGNRGRHSVIPIPFNEAQIATTSSPAMIMGAQPHSSGESASYGVEVLNQDSTPDGYDYAPIKSEPWSTYDGGNVDFRAPYVGYSPNSTLFETVGNSAYDALQTHLEKRLSHHYQLGASYTWAHSLDEQSDLGLFFTGNNPANLRSSWASSDFDRTNVFSGNFLAQLPNYAHANTWLSYLTNDWNLTGIGILQSGQPYSLYEYYGAAGSAYVGNDPTLMNPVLGIKDPSQVRSAMTGNKGSFRGAGGNYIPAIDPTQLSLNYLAPGEKGVPTAAQGNPGDPLDTYETDFATGDQRNIFRQAAQKRLDISFRKTVKVKDRVSIQYAFNIFNVTNTTSLDVPQNQTQVRQTNYACSTTAMANPNGNCAGNYLYGQVATDLADQASNNGRGTAGLALDKLPYVNGTGSGITVPTVLPVGQGSCQSASLANGGCPNNGANFGSVTGAIGGGRAITMGIHINY